MDDLVHRSLVTKPSSKVDLAFGLHGLLERGSQARPWVVHHWADSLEYDPECQPQSPLWNHQTHYEPALKPRPAISLPTHWETNSRSLQNPWVTKLRLTTDFHPSWSFHHLKWPELIQGVIETIDLAHVRGESQSRLSLKDHQELNNLTTPGALPGPYFSIKLLHF